MQMEINITKKHIDAGRIGDPLRCPIARGVKDWIENNQPYSEEHQLEQVLTYKLSTAIWFKDLSYTKSYLNFEHDDQIAQFVYDYDKYGAGAVEPFTIRFSVDESEMPISEIRKYGLVDGTATVLEPED